MELQNLTKVGFRCYTKDKTNVGFADIEKINLKVGDKVIVKYKNNNIDLGLITYISKCEKEPKKTIKNIEDYPIIERLAQDKEIAEAQKNREFCKDALKKCYDLIKKHKLPMFLLDAHYTLDKSKLTFYFSAANRVDFRELVKDLAHIFRTRIELFQVGVRDEAKRLSGLGICGMEICCSRFLYDFNSVTIKMAKNQNLNLTPTKISGICGRLLCCLNYENDFYIEQLKKFPPQFCQFKINDNIGKIINFNVLTMTVSYNINDGYTKEMPLDEFMKNFGNTLIYTDILQQSEDELINEELKKLEEE
ncbi:MAG TPA: regulatory iron-sulfur-containing complex subunit RicT [bacterium]|nr:regulatory iron-sulfur-containing complex subunit RicT [bacterium]